MLIDEIKNIVSTKKKAQKFGLQIGTMLILIAALLIILHKNYFYYLMISGGILILLGFVFPKSLVLPNKFWMTFGVLLGYFTSRIILFVLFYLIITPMSLMAKLAGKDFLDEKIDKQQKSYWNKREYKVYNKSQTEKQF